MERDSDWMRRYEEWQAYGLEAALARIFYGTSTWTAPAYTPWRTCRVWAAWMVQELRRRGI